MIEEIAKYSGFEEFPLASNIKWTWPDETFHDDLPDILNDISEFLKWIAPSLGQVNLSYGLTFGVHVQIWNIAHDHHSSHYGSAGQVARALCDSAYCLIEDEIEEELLIEAALKSGYGRS